MSYGLLWVEALAIALLWVAMWAAIAARLRSRNAEAIVLFLAITAMALFLGVFVVVAAVLKFDVALEENWFAYTLSLWVASLLGAVAILIRARRRPQPGLARAAASWPRERLALALAALSTLGAMTLWNMDLTVRSEAANLRTEAGAMLLSVAPPQVEDDRNAAVLYEKAFARLKQDRSLNDRGSPLVADDPDPSSPAVAQLLARHETTLRLLRDATSMPACRFDHDYARPSISMLLPELNGARTAGILLDLDARRAAVAGDAGRAVADINALFRLARAAGSNPMLISALVDFGIDRIGTRSLEQVLPHLRRPDDLGRLRIGEPASLARLARRGLQGEEALGISVFSELATGSLTIQELTGTSAGKSRGEVSVPDLPPLPLLTRVFVMPSDVRAYQTYMESFQRMAEQPFPRSTEGAGEVTHKAAKHGLLTSLLVPALNRFLLQAAQGEAYHGAAWAGVAAERYRLDHGAFPSTLDALVPEYLDEVPIDPFDGGPLKARIRGDELVIYSLGPDRKDDGGAPFDQKARTGDLVFAVPSPPTSAPSSEPAQR